MVQNDAKKIDASKNLQNQTHQLAYSINPLNLAAFKKTHGTAESLGINANNEIINIAQLVDLDSILCQPKARSNVVPTISRIKQPKIENIPPKLHENQSIPSVSDSNVIKIELTQNDLNNLTASGALDLNQLKLPHIKPPQQSQTGKFAYSIKIDDVKSQALILNQLSDLNNSNNQQINLNSLNINGNLYQNAALASSSAANFTPNVNITSQFVSTPANVICSTSNVICSTSNANSTSFGQLVQEGKNTKHFYTRWSISNGT